MNALQKAVDDIKFRIPRRLLEKTFLPRASDWRTRQFYSLDELIIQNVIKARVMPDCNMVGGAQITIDLSGISWVQDDLYVFSAHIPKTKTNGRSIVSVINLSFLSQSLASSYFGVGQINNNGALTPQEDSMLMALANGLVQSANPIPITCTSRVQLVAENTVQVRGVNYIMPFAYLRCVIANDENMSNISFRSIREFSNLCVLATKAFIYNELIIEMGSGELEYGQELGIFKSKIEEYADADEQYATFRDEVWQKVSVMNDEEAHHRLLRLAIPAHQ